MREVQERWVITWFPPEVEQRERVFIDETKARAFAVTEGVIEWHPAMVQRITTTTVVERVVVPLFEPA